MPISRKSAVVATALSTPFVLWSLYHTGLIGRSVPQCEPVPDRPLRVGITDWAGFAGGIFANHGFHTAKTERTRFRFPVEFVNIEGLRESEKALSEPCGVDVLWSS